MMIFIILLGRIFHPCLKMLKNLIKPSAILFLPGKIILKVYRNKVTKMWDSAANGLHGC